MPEVTKEPAKAEKPSEPRAELSDNLVAKAYWGTAEETYFRSPMVPESYEGPYNTDDLYKKTGDYSIYEDMLDDDQVSVCLNFKKDLVMGSGFSIVSEDDKNVEIKEDLELALTEDVEEPFLEQVEEILSAYEFGFSLTEKVFKKSDDGKLRLKCLRTRQPNSWRLHQDDKGEVIKFEQITSRESFKEINPLSLIHYINNKRFQNPYGRSDLRSAYAAWFAKRHVVRFYGIYMEGSAKPIPVARYDKNAPDSAVTKIFNTIKNLQAKTAMVLPKEIEMEYLESKTNGEAYSKAIDIFNMFIGRALFIPDLLGISGSETGGGSYSLGKEQIGMFFMHIGKRRAKIENLINKHIIEPLVYYNYGLVEDIPKFKFNPLDDVQATEYAKTWLEAMGKKLWKANDVEINHFRKLVKFPEGDVERDAPMAPGQVDEDGNPIPPTDPNQPPPAGGGKPGEKAGEKKGEPLPNKQDAKDSDSKREEFAKSWKMEKGEYYKKVNFAAIKTKLDDYDQSIVDDTRKVVSKIFEDLYDQLAKKNIVKNGDLSRAEGLKLKHLKELKQCLKGSFMQLYKDAQGQASSELFKSEYASPVLGDDFLGILETETFDYVGDWQYKVLQGTRTQLAAAIKDGRPLSEVIGLLDAEGKKLAEESIARYSRTKHTEVLNKGRLEFFKESGVVAAYQYSAIMDNQTSDICAGLNGKVFKAGSEPVPPMHFNCRSVLIPITKYEEWEADSKVGSKNINDFIEENKGRGFATK